MGRTWIRLVGVAIVEWLAAASSTGSDVEDVEAVLVEHYLDPLAEPGVAA